MKLLFSIFLLLSTYIAYSQPETMWQLLQNNDIIRWAYVDGDEFDGPTLNEDKWRNSYPWGRNYSGTCYQEYMTDGQNMQFSNGILKLIAKQENIYAKGVPYQSPSFLLEDGGPNLRWWNYTSGMIFSKRQYKYGLFEISCKMPAGKGFWPAFWVYSGVFNEELDVFEYKGENPNQIHINVHKFGNQAPNQWYTANGSFAGSFNSIMAEWGPNAIYWYLNYQDFGIWLGNLDFPANIIANFGIASSDYVDGDPCPFGPGPDNTTPFPAYFEIDYIRVWTKLDCEQSIIISNSNPPFAGTTTLAKKDISMHDYDLNSGNYLNIVATDLITIELNTNISGIFEAKLVDCPGPSLRIGEDTNENKRDTSLLNISNHNPKIKSKSKPVLYTKIYPNPTQGKIKIEFKGDLDRDITIKLVSSAGEEVFLKEKIQDDLFEIDISHLPKGTYYLTGIFDGSVISDKIVLK